VIRDSRGCKRSIGQGRVRSMTKIERFNSNAAIEPREAARTKKQGGREKDLSPRCSSASQPLQKQFRAFVTRRNEALREPNLRAISSLVTDHYVYASILIRPAQSTTALSAAICFLRLRRPFISQEPRFGGVAWARKVNGRRKRRGNAIDAGNPDYRLAGGA